MDIYSIFILSFCFLILFGSLLHFTHDWVKKGILLHIFSALNESTWEHMKLLVAPTILVGILQYIFLKGSYQNLFNSIFILLLVEAISIPLLFEPLRILLKKVPFPITILIFILSILFGLLTQSYFLKNNISLFSEEVALLLSLGIVGIFAIFSYYPPKIFLFKDPVTGKYGDVKEH
ncbi:MAG TPA: DUF6512 family protein [Candidatus Dojkabacteria bacterium]|nr:DUF6512 family protein [Candidatus Dojkabacteria bacterium]HQC39414.1 DUF6512 family protein [Candidatus Dojkabacteria bacterium]